LNPDCLIIGEAGLKGCTVALASSRAVGTGIGILSWRDDPGPSRIDAPNTKATSICINVIKKISPSEPQLERIAERVSPAAPESEIREAINGQSFAKYGQRALTDEVNYIVDNEKQKSLRAVGVRSARACVTMPSAAT
jgi:hypothetical protein